MLSLPHCEIRVAYLLAFVVRVLTLVLLLVECFQTTTTLGQETSQAKRTVVYVPVRVLVLCTGTTTVTRAGGGSAESYPTQYQYPVLYHWYSTKLALKLPAF